MLTAKIDPCKDVYCDYNEECDYYTGRCGSYHHLEHYTRDVIAPTIKVSMSTTVHQLMSNSVCLAVTRDLCKAVYCEDYYKCDPYTGKCSE